MMGGIVLLMTSFVELLDLDAGILEDLEHVLGGEFSLLLLAGDFLLEAGVDVLDHAEDLGLCFLAHLGIGLEGRYLLLDEQLVLELVDVDLDLRGQVLRALLPSHDVTHPAYLCLLSASTWFLMSCTCWLVSCSLDTTLCSYAWLFLCTVMVSEEKRSSVCLPSFTSDCCLVYERLRYDGLRLFPSAALR